MKKNDHKQSRRKIFLIFRICIALILSLILFLWLDLKVVWQNITSMEVWYLPLILSFALIDRYLMAYKWSMLLRVRGVDISNWEAFKIYLSAGFAQTFLPTGIGADAFKLTRTTVAGGELNKVAVSIILERVIGLIAITVLALLGFTLVLVEKQIQFQNIFYFVSLILLILLIGFYLSINATVSKFINKKFARFKKYKIFRKIHELHNTYKEFSQHRRVLFWFFLLSVFENGILSIMNFLAAKSLNFDVALIYFFVIVPMLGLLGTLPITINGIGVTEGLYVLLLSFIGISENQSLSLALLLRAIGLIMLIPGALVIINDSFGIKRINDVDNKKV